MKTSEEGSKPQIIWIDDSKKNLPAIEESLKGLNCQLRYCENIELLQTMPAQTAATILLHMDFNSRQSLELAREIRGWVSTKETPIIFISSSDISDRELDRMDELGGFTIVDEPINPKVLRPKIKFFIDLFEKARRLQDQSHWFESKAESQALRMALIANAIPDVIAYVGRDERYQFANSAYEDWFGVSGSEVIGKAMKDVIGDTYETCKPYIAEVLKGKEVNFHAPVAGRGGAHRVVLAKYIPDKEPSGFVRGFIIVAHDVTDLHRSREAIENQSREAMLAAQKLGEINLDLESRIADRTRELSEAYHFAESVLENIPNMIFVKDAKELRFLRFNRAGEELLGISRHELLGKNDYDLFPESEAKWFQSKDREVIAGRKILDIPEEELQTAHRGKRILHTKKIPVFDQNGIPKFLVGISEDITEKKRSEGERLQLIEAKIEKQESDRAMERLSFLADASVRLGTSLELESILTTLTQISVPAIADWCSVQLIQPDGKLKQLAVAHQDPEKVKWAWKLHEKYAPARNTDKDVPSQVVKSRTSQIIPVITQEMLDAAAMDEERRNIIHSIGFHSYICSPILVRGKVIGALTLVTTSESGRRFTEADLRLVEELCNRAGIAIENARLFLEAQNLNHLKDEFLANLSHELRTPMNVILGFSEILKSDGDEMSKEEFMSCLDAIERNAKAQGEIIADLLDVSAIITGKVTYNPQEIKPVEVVEGILRGFVHAAEAKGIHLNSDFRGAPELIRADPTRLHQIIWNLLSNAIKFTERNGTVEIKIESTDRDWTVTVKDTGRGIDSEFLPYVFDRFRQEDASTTRRYGGLGLGLSVVRHLVELHGGSVRAESEGRGHGATFVVTMPLMASERELAEKPQVAKNFSSEPVADGPTALADRKILVIDDSKDNLNLIHRILAQAGAHVTDATSAQEARDKLKSLQPDIIVSDLGMPGESGFEFIRRIRSSENSKLKNTPAIALTAYARDEDRNQALAAGFHAHVAKPINSKVLISEIQKLI